MGKRDKKKNKQNMAKTYRKKDYEKKLKQES